METTHRKEEKRRQQSNTDGQSIREAEKEKNEMEAIRRGCEKKRRRRRE